jgi:Rad3-related DNA helicase
MFYKVIKLNNYKVELLYIVNIIYLEDSRYMKDYGMILTEKTRTERGRPITEHTLEMVCLNPAIAFKEIKNKVRSLILTSGTLSPMNTFASELDMQFPIVMEGNHVVKNEQVCVAVIPTSKTGYSFKGTFQFTESFEYQDNLGRSILDIIRIIPHGVLCFVSSYNMLEKLMNRWKANGVYKTMAAIKNILLEPKGSDKSDFEKVYKKFHTLIEDSVEDSKKGIKGGGCLLFAVFRGKVRGFIFKVI